MITQALAANGAKVYITGRRADVLENAARTSADTLGPSGGTVIPLTMDVTSKDSIKGAVDEISKKEGHVNILVNNAGVWKGRAAAKPEDGAEKYGDAMFDMSIDDSWQQAYLTNCTSCYFVTAAFLPLLAKAASTPIGTTGTVINISSVSGMLNVSQNSQYSYNCSKAAINHLTRQMAFELVHENVRIRVNGIAPGWFPSEMTTGPSGSYDKEKLRLSMLKMGAKVDRMGTPDEIASIVLTLATNEYMWGTIIPVDGGALLQLPGIM
ncbi:hypothetical protein BJ170DRAFT_70894 [Xylariales sp. AK1849]|nr:hypothetical protein BJ170DRAFT_70894 [Xylariales sp. AK1849]